MSRKDEELQPKESFGKIKIRLRSGHNCLFLEKGRYADTPHEERIFPLRKNGIDDNKHVILKCEK